MEVVTFDTKFSYMKLISHKIFFWLSRVIKKYTEISIQTIYIWQNRAIGKYCSITAPVWFAYWSLSYPPCHGARCPSRWKGIGGLMPAEARCSLPELFCWFSGFYTLCWSDRALTLHQWDWLAQPDIHTLIMNSGTFTPQLIAIYLKQRLLVPFVLR